MSAGYRRVAGMITTPSGSFCLVAARSNQPDQRAERTAASVSSGLASAAAGAAGAAHGRPGRLRVVRATALLLGWGMLGARYVPAGPSRPGNALRQACRGAVSARNGLAEPIGKSFLALP